MTLFRQLMVIIAGMFFLVFLGTLWVSISDTRSFLQLQLESHAQDTATSLGLSLAPVLSDEDLVLAQSMVDAIFDRGYYRSIVLRSLDGEVLIERSNPQRIEGVPDWFVSLLPLRAPEVSTVINAGWLQVGELRVAGHPGLAYRRLWDTVVGVSRWSAAIFLASGALLAALLHVLLIPLGRVEAQAKALGDREYPIVNRIPRTREFARLVGTMNDMARKVKASVSELTESMERYHTEAYTDALTGLDNRRAFNARMQGLLSLDEKGGTGLLALVRIHGLQAINQRHGYKKGDAVIADFAQCLKGLAQGHGQALVARLAGADFAMVLPGADHTEAETLGERIGVCLAATLDEPISEDMGAVGLTTYRCGESLSDVLAGADEALSEALSRGPGAWALRSALQETVVRRGELQWKGLLESAIQARSLALVRLPVWLRSGVGYHLYLGRLKDQQSRPVPAADYLPMAQRLGLMDALDRLVLERLSEVLEGVEPSRAVAVNLSVQSLFNEGFLRWLDGFLGNHAALAGRLIVELPEQGASQYPHQTRRLVELVHHYRGRFALKHFGLSMTSFRSLHQAKLDLIKVDGSYIRGIAGDAGNQFFVRNLLEMARGLGFRVIAECVENQQDYDCLHRMGIHGMQGFHIGKEKPA